MSKKPQVGEWWLTRNNQSVRVVFTSHEATGTSEVFSVLCVRRAEKGQFSSDWYTDDGRFHVGPGTHNLDLVEHLPKCTGWDWKPEVWRPVKPEDLLRPGIVVARFRHDANEEWLRSTLIGAKWSFGYLCWMADDGRSSVFRECEVLDDGN